MDKQLFYILVGIISLIVVIGIIILTTKQNFIQGDTEASGYLTSGIFAITDNDGSTWSINIDNNGDALATNNLNKQMYKMYGVTSIPYFNDYFFWQGNSSNQPPDIMQYTNIINKNQGQVVTGLPLTITDPAQNITINIYIPDWESCNVNGVGSIDNCPSINYTQYSDIIQEGISSNNNGYY